MEQSQGWVKIFRSIVNWEWYDDANTFRMFFHLIVTANHETVSWKGRLIKRGQRLTTIRRLADELSIDEKTVQRCLRNLESTKEIKIEPSKSGTMITVRKYNEWQMKPHWRGSMVILTHHLNDGIFDVEILLYLHDFTLCN